MANLLEAYKERLAVSEKVYAKSHLGESMNNFKKIATAKCLENIDKFLTESFANSSGTQRSDLGMWKKFTLNLTTVAVPNLIAYDLVIVQPMSSISGYITYLQYTAGSNKGGVSQGTVFNEPFKLGNIDKNYTSDKVTEAKPAATAGAAAGTLNWRPVVANTVNIVIGSAEYNDNAGKLFKGEVEVGTINYDTGEYAIADITLVDATAVFANYVYNNVVVPQNDVPLLNAQMQSIPLIAKARRIAVYYSQMAAYQAKTDYGFDMGDQLAEKAVGQLSYEIDTEITQLLIDNAANDGDLVWSKTLSLGVSKAEHYEGFSEIIEIAKQKIYDATKKFTPNYMIIASNILPILTFIKGFTAAPTGSMNGPYFAGTLGNLKVFVTPNIEPGKFVIGVNGDDMMSSAAVYAPYMTIVPTQLLSFADGGMSQGYSTMYDLKMLNSSLLVSGRVTA